MVHVYINSLLKSSMIYSVHSGHTEMMYCMAMFGYNIPSNRERRSFPSRDLRQSSTTPTGHTRQASVRGSVMVMKFSVCLVIRSSSAPVKKGLVILQASLVT